MQKDSVIQFCDNLLKQPNNDDLKYLLSVAKQMNLWTREVLSLALMSSKPPLSVEVLQKAQNQMIKDFGGVIEVPLSKAQISWINAVNDEFFSVKIIS